MSKEEFHIAGVYGILVTPVGMVMKKARLREHKLYIGKDEYMVDMEHKSFMRRKTFLGHKWYMVFFLDPERKISIAPPLSAKPLEAKEEELSASIRVRWYSEQMLKEKEQALQRMQKTMMIVIAVVVVACIALIGFTNWSFTQQLKEALETAIQRFTPPP